MLRLQADLNNIINNGGTDHAVTTATAGLEELKTLSFDELISRLAQSLVGFAINLAIAILVFYIGRFVIRKIYRIVSSIFIRRQIDKSLSTFILSLINIVLYFILIVTVIGILGIETTSFLALFASAGVAVGMALSGTLQNFAGGVLILLLKPYKIGDYIEVQGFAGTVKEIQIFHTIITTYDNKSISIPNGGLSTGSVNNWSRESYRRVSWIISVSYGDSIDDARAAILDMLLADERVEKGRLATPEIEAVGGISAVNPELDEQTTEEQTGEPDANTEAETTEEEPAKSRSWLGRIVSRHRQAKEIIHRKEEERREKLLKLIPKPDYTPKVVVKLLNSSSVDIEVRAWTRTVDYWNVFYYYNEKFYNELPAHGIHFPFPQMDVHMRQD